MRNSFHLTTCVVVSLCLSTALAAVAKAEKRNVIFIAVDDLNDWVGYLGGHPQAKTPHLDAFAKSATAFEHAYCPAPVCGPSRTALMYGISPHKSGSYGHDKIYDAGKILPQDRLPLNLVFQNNGYYTAGCGKIFHYAEKRGWDLYRSNLPGTAPMEIHRVGELDYGMQDTEDDGDTSDGKLTEWAIEQLQAPHKKPFFIALGLRKPHLPWVAPKKYFEPFDTDSVQLPKVPSDDLDDLPAAGKAFARSIIGFNHVNDHAEITKEPEGWQQLVRAYLATCSFSDANVGRLLDALENSPHRDNTIVVLWGDHGWHLGEKEHWRKMTLWERGTRTPFIIRVPGAKAQRVEAPVSLQDIFPTLVDLCELKVDQELDGNSLKPLITGSVTKAWEKPVIMSHGPGNFAIRQETWRLIHYADGSEELYDLKADPGELVNLAEMPEHKERLQQLRQHLPTTWRYVMGPRFKTFPGAFAKPPSAD